MKVSRTFIFQACVSLALSFGSCLPGHLGGRARAVEDPLSGLPDDVAEEEEREAMVQGLLGTLREGFLRQLNMSEAPQEKFRVSPPQFMMELYNKYTSERSPDPQFDIIRSFSVDEISPSVTNGVESKHRLWFNVSVPRHEKITAAQLQILFLPPGAGSEVRAHRFKAAVEVYEAAAGGSGEFWTPALAGREVARSRAAWETFDVTAAVRRWVGSSRGASAFDVAVMGVDCGAGRGGCWNMSLSVGDNTSAALTVFSFDLENRKRRKVQEVTELMLMRGGPNKAPHSRLRRRAKRKAERGSCRRSSLKVSFKDIGWDSWIVAPPEYDAFECRGVCSYPMTDESTPSKHAVIQSLMSILDPGATSTACCVPTKLDPITVMYQENGRLTIRYLYEEMKVAECGCR